MNSLLLLLLIFMSGATQPAVPEQSTNTGSSPVPPVVSRGACYALESGVSLTIDEGDVISDCAEEVGGKTYVRIRQGVKIVNAKIAEGKSNWSSCKTTEPTGYGALRKIGPVAGEGSDSAGDTAVFGDIFWEDLNYLGNDLSDFLLVVTNVDSKYHQFDVYIDETLKNNPPEFVTNCKETGGLVPVLEGPTTNQFPAYAFSLTDSEFNGAGEQSFDNAGFEENFAEFAEYISDGYYMFVAEQDVLPQSTDAGGPAQVGVLTKTLNGETRQYDLYFHAGVMYVVGVSGQEDEGKVWLFNPTDTKPPLSMGKRNPTLQLAAMKFISTSEWTWATPECKPALYLYPPDRTDLTVRVIPNGKITVSIPAHGDYGWSVTAYPNGEIKSSGNSYPYLYYETELLGVVPPEKGWIVGRENIPEFLTALLPKLGLNDKERQDFISYWIPKLNDYLASSDGKIYPRLFIGLLPSNQLNKLEEIQFSAKPDEFLRVRFYFEKIDGLKHLGVNPPDLSEYQIKRAGFTAVDWGGILENGSCGKVESSR